MAESVAKVLVLVDKGEGFEVLVQGEVMSDAIDEVEDFVQDIVL